MMFKLIERGVYIVFRTQFRCTSWQYYLIYGGMAAMPEGKQNHSSSCTKSYRRDVLMCISTGNLKRLKATAQFLRMLHRSGGYDLNVSVDIEVSMSMALRHNPHLLHVVRDF